MWRLPPAVAARAASALLVWAIGSLLLMVGSAGPADASGGQLKWSASLNGTDLSSTATPLELKPAAAESLVLQLQNTGTTSVTVRSVRLEGRVMGLAFLSSTTRLDITLPPGGSTERNFDLYLDDLDQQARGLLPGRLLLIGSDRSTIDSIPVPMRIKGSLTSVYAVFGLVVAVGTLVNLAGLLYAVWVGRLPENRWRRAIWFLPVGLGLGLTATFTLSAFSLLLPSATLWLPLVLGCGGGAFLVGYFWILIMRRDDDDQDDQATDGDEADDDHMVPALDDDRTSRWT